MKQSESELVLLDTLFKKKSAVPYDGFYVSSSINEVEPQLGTHEADASGKFGRWAPEEFRASKMAALAASIDSVSTVLDVGGGNLLASSYFSRSGLVCDVSDFKTSPYLTDTALRQSGIRDFIDGDFNTQSVSGSYDLVWASHVLEHQLNVHAFIEKLVSCVAENGYLAIAVPPRKPFIVSGHVNLFNPGLLLYRVVLAGVDCSEAKVFQYDGNICLLVKVARISLPRLNYDIGDIEKLSGFFPNAPSDGFNGDFMCQNLTDAEKKIVYGVNAKYIK